MIIQRVIDIDGKSADFKFKDMVDFCPICGTGINPTVLGIYINHPINEVSDETKAWIICRCPLNYCRSIFIGVYHYWDNPSLHYFYGPFSIFPKVVVDKKFSDIILDISPTYIQIYNQAFYAEQQELDLIAGPGYRKALEFLIKDYAKKSLI